MYLPAFLTVDHLSDTHGLGAELTSLTFIFPLDSHMKIIRTLQNGSCLTPHTDLKWQ